MPSQVEEDGRAGGVYLAAPPRMRSMIMNIEYRYIGKGRLIIIIKLGGARRGATLCACAVKPPTFFDNVSSGYT